MSTPASTRYEKHRYNAERAEAHYQAMRTIHGEKHPRTMHAERLYCKQMEAAVRFGGKSPTHGTADIM